MTHGIENRSAYLSHDIANVFSMLGSSRRLDVLSCLSNRERNVGELAQLVGISQSALSQHLKKLRKAGMVVTRRDEQRVYYSLAPGEITSVINSALIARDQFNIHTERNN